MRWLIKIVGYVLMALIVAGLCMQLLLAFRANQPFYGVNYKGLPLGTYLTAAILFMVSVIGVIWVVQRVLGAMRRRK